MEKLEKIKKLGKGNFGEVLLVKNNEDGKLYALKRQHIANYESNTKHSPDNEVKILRTLRHPNITQYFNCFNHKQKFCFLMEYADEGDLLERVKAAKKFKYNIDQDTVLSWFAQICLAIKYLHDNNILHRDIKVQNVFLMKTGLLKLGDFGISKVLENANDMAQTSLGTPYYLSPEILSSSPYNYKSDIWMLGCLLYELCALEKPFLGESIHGIIKKISTEDPPKIPELYSPFVWGLIKILLTKNPERRPTITDVLDCPEIKQKAQEAINSFPEYKKFENPYSKDRASIKIQTGTPIQYDEAEKAPPKGTPNHIEKLNTLKLTTNISESKGSPKTPLIKPSIPESHSQEFEPKHEKSKVNTGVMAVNSIHYLIQKARKLTNMDDFEKQSDGKEDPKYLSKSAVPTLSTGNKNNAEEQEERKDDREKIKHLDATKFSTGRRVSKTMSINFAEDEEKNADSTCATNNFVSPINRMTVKNAISSGEFNSGQKLLNLKQSDDDKKKVNFNKSTTPMGSTQNSKFSVVNLFNSRESVTPARAMLMMDFVKQRIGLEKFEKLQKLLIFNSSDNAEELFEERKSAIQSILGEENTDLLKLLKLHALSSNGQIPSIKDSKFSITASDQPKNKFRKATDYQYDMQSSTSSLDGNNSNRKKTSSEEVGMK